MLARVVGWIRTPIPVSVVSFVIMVRVVVQKVLKGFVSPSPRAVQKSMRLSVVVMVGLMGTLVRPTP